MITGSSGQLGSELKRQLQEGGSTLGAPPGAMKASEVFYSEIGDLDITDKASVDACMERLRPNVVFHCAAMTNVDGCEEVPEQANQINGIAAGHVAEACEKVGAKMVFVSSDYVFSGKTRRPYMTDDVCDPQTAYGRSKRLGEQKVLEACSRAFIVRAAWLYGFHGNNFVKTILRKAKDTGSLQVVSDQFGNPTNAEDLAYHMLQLAATEKYGIYHCTGNGVCSWYDFASEIIRLSGLPCRVLPCTSEEYPKKAKRPAYSALDHSALTAAIGDKMRPWQEALRDYINQLEGIG